MKAFVISLVLVVSVFAAVLASHCPHGDISGCSLDCSDPNEVPGCEHEICTCVPKPVACHQKADCNMVSCEKHDETPQCLNGACACLNGHCNA